jgi:hypothetical protein
MMCMFYGNEILHVCRNWKMILFRRLRFEGVRSRFDPWAGTIPLGRPR